ncbi:MAG: hypothetical protein AAB423_03995 [Patescibacteria group bacterium]
MATQQQQEQQQEVQAKCTSCGGTGLYKGMAEPPGVAVICLDCEGTGARTITFIPYTGRVKCEDVQTVQRSAGKFIAFGTGPVGEKLSYQDFLKEIPEAEVVATT